MSSPEQEAVPATQEDESSDRGLASQSLGSPEAENATTSTPKGDRTIAEEPSTKEVQVHSSSNEEDEKEADDDERDSDDDDVDDDDEKRKGLTVGGEIDTDAFALLDGLVYSVSDSVSSFIVEMDSMMKFLVFLSHAVYSCVLRTLFKDPHDASKFKTISVPLTRLPATLGRTHDTKDGNFFGLGERKSLSRQQCRIYYQDARGGKLIQQGSSDTISYQPPPAKKQKIIPLHADKPLPADGFYAIECLGKNRITVGKSRVEQGEVAQLQNGTPIRISTYCLYFLLPTDVSDNPVTMAIPNPAYKKKPAAPKAIVQPSSGGMASIYAKLESRSAQELLAEFKAAVESGQWERNHQIMAGVICVHGVKAAARDKAIRKIARKEGGVRRSAIIDWLENSPEYSMWVTQMKSKVEHRSYQGNVSKALVKAGYTRVGTSGPFVKWLLPDGEGDESESSDVSDDSDDEKKQGDESEKAPPDSTKAVRDKEESDKGGKDESDESDASDGDSDMESGAAQQSEESPSQLTKDTRAVDNGKNEAEDRDHGNAEEEEDESVETPSPNMAENPSADLIANENDESDHGVFEQKGKGQ